jgi:hypothetical protein
LHYLVSNDTLCLLALPRPTFKELTTRLKEATEAFRTGNWAFLELPLILDDLAKLQLFDERDFQEGVKAALAEIAPEKYKGQRPPAKASKEQIRGRELFAFSWDSKHFGMPVYFKFALQAGTLWIVSLHEDRPGGRPYRSKEVVA